MFEAKTFDDRNILEDIFSFFPHILFLLYDSHTQDTQRVRYLKKLYIFLATYTFNITLLKTFLSLLFTFLWALPTCNTISSSAFSGTPCMCFIKPPHSPFPMSSDPSSREGHLLLGLWSRQLESDKMVYWVSWNTTLRGWMAGEPFHLGVSITDILPKVFFCQSLAVVSLRTKPRSLFHS